MMDDTDPGIFGFAAGVSNRERKTDSSPALHVANKQVALLAASHVGSGRSMGPEDVVVLAKRFVRYLEDDL